MDSLKFKSPAFGCDVELIEDVNNGIALTRAKWRFVEATAISVSEDDAIRMRDWLNARYPIAQPAPQPEQSELVEAHRKHAATLISSRIPLIEALEQIAAGERVVERSGGFSEVENDMTIDYPAIAIEALAKHRAATAAQRGDA